MDELNRVAQSLQLLRGTLSRWLLPFDNNTAISDQSSDVHSVVETMPPAIRGKLTEKQVGLYSSFSFFLPASICQSVCLSSYHCMSLHQYHILALCPAYKPGIHRESQYAYDAISAYQWHGVLPLCCTCTH